MRGRRIRGPCRRGSWDRAFIQPVWSGGNKVWGWDITRTSPPGPELLPADLLQQQGPGAGQIPKSELGWGDTEGSVP